MTTVETPASPEDFALPTCFPPSHPIPGDDGRTTWRAETAALVDGYRNLLLDVVVPGASTPVPVVVWVHGGAFRMGATEEVWSPWFVAMRESVLAAGFAFAAVSYRFSREAPFPAQLDDARAGLRYLRHYAGTFGIDPDRVALWGGSAGAQLALLTAFTAGHPAFPGRVGVDGPDAPVRAVVSYFAVTDAAALDDDDLSGAGGRLAADSPIALLIGGSPVDHPDRVRAISPLSHVRPGLPPVLAVHGTVDVVVGPGQSRRLVSALRAAGVPAELVEIPGADHGFADVDMRPVLRRTIDFLVAHLEPVAPFEPTASAGAMPRMIPDLDRALFVRNLAKPVRRHLVIDDMETDRGWRATPAAELDYTSERSRSGTRSLRLRFDQRNEDHIRASRAANGSFDGQGIIFEHQPFAVAAHLGFGEPQDWTAYNRISLWCYVHPTGNPVSALALQFLSDGAPSGPSDPIAITYFADLREGEWNHLVWEIPELRRDRVVDLSFFQPTWGLNFADAENRRTFDIDELRLEVVDADQVEGWAIAPGRIAYSHVGYPVDGPKIALVSEDVREFRLLDDRSGEAVATLPARRVETRHGAYSELDFTSVVRPGDYRIVAGAAHSEAFPLSATPWRELVRATLHGLASMRCGAAVPGAHDACHLDHLVVHGDATRVQGGGWHDAANLSQVPWNTHITVCALLDLAEALGPHDPELAAAALAEAEWGLDWVRRMRFGPGIRYREGAYSFYTDGVLGTEDDILDENVGDERFLVITGALAAVRGARALRDRDPAVADELLRTAREDFDVVLRDRSGPPTEPDPPAEPDWRVEPWQNEVGQLTLLATELARATGEQRYADEAARLGRHVLELQELAFVDGSPVAGYYYEDAARSRILHEDQRTSGAPHSFEDACPLALQALCETFPDHPDWIAWYAGLLAYSEFFCRVGSTAAAPFDLLPAAVWRDADLEAASDVDKNATAFANRPNPLFPTPPTPELVQAQRRELYEAGARLSEHQRLRTFPIPQDRVRHGSTAIHLTKAIGLGAAAQVRRRPELRDLLARQVHWLVGLNPFSRSLVYGVGYDWRQNFTVSLPNFVGGLSVGMNTLTGDAPAWGDNAVFPYKEVWVISMARLAAVLARVAAPAPVLDAAPAVDVQATPIEQNGVLSALRISATGTGCHDLELRCANLALDRHRLELDLGATPAVVEVPAAVVDPSHPWVVVVVPDGDPAAAREAFGPHTALPPD